MRSTVIPPTSADYPPELLAIGAPPTLYVRGALPPLPAVAIVGTRRATEAALTFTADLATILARAGVAIWSGGAYGIDRAAHEGALEAGGATVVVFAGGLDRRYPPEHGALFDRVLASGGAWLARVPDDKSCTLGGFQARNTLLGALTRATVVVQAGLKSGAWSTASAARRFGRPVRVVPQPPWDPVGEGCATALVRGARAVASAADVLALLGLPASVDARAPVRRAPAVERGGRGEEPLEPDERAVVSVLGPEALHFDLVCERSRLSTGRVAAALLTLTIKAVVVEGPAGSFRWASSSLS